MPEALEPGSLEAIVQTGNAKSSAFMVPVAKAAPSVFPQFQAGTGIGASVNYSQGSALTTMEAPAAPNDIEVTYLTGLGSPVEMPEVTLTGSDGQEYAGSVLWAGKAPGFEGLDQVNWILPADLPPDAYQLTFTVIDHKSSPTDLPVANPGVTQWPSLNGPRPSDQTTSRAARVTSGAHSLNPHRPSGQPLASLAFRAWRSETQSLSESTSGGFPAKRS